MKKGIQFIIIKRYEDPVVSLIFSDQSIIGRLCQIVLFKYGLYLKMISKTIDHNRKYKSHGILKMGDKNHKRKNGMIMMTVFTVENRNTDHMIYDLVVGIGDIMPLIGCIVVQAGARTFMISMGMIRTLFKGIGTERDEIFNDMIIQQIKFLKRVK